MAARDEEDSGRAAAALDDLCRSYWFPIYFYVRRRGYSAEDAEDLTQGYFAALIEKDYLSDADRERGKLRSFLLVTLKHYISDEWSKASALKRGGGRPVVSIDAAKTKLPQRIAATREATKALTTTDLASCSRVNPGFSMASRNASFS